MLSVLPIIFPIFAAIALGFGCARFGVFAPRDMQVLTRFVANVALPALLFLAVAQRDFEAIFDLSYMAAYLFGALLSMALAYAAFSLARVAPSRRAVGVMGAACPNSGFVGYPLMLLLFPAAAGQILALNMLVENFVIIPLCLVLFELAKPAGSGRVASRMADVFFSIFKRPFVLGLLAGLLVSVLQIPLPAPVVRTADMFASAASAIALFAIGGALHGLPMQGQRAIAASIAALKLLLHPAMVALAVAALPLLGFAPLSKDMAAAVVLSAAIPMFSIYVIFAGELGHDGMASISQVAATAASFVTLSALMLWLL